jgi:hypothetical protein
MNLMGCIFVVYLGFLLPALMFRQKLWYRVKLGAKCASLLVAGLGFLCGAIGLLDSLL